MVFPTVETPRLALLTSYSQTFLFPFPSGVMTVMALFPSSPFSTKAISLPSGDHLGMLHLPVSVSFTASPPLVGTA